MSGTSLATIPLRTASIATIALAGFHFALPEVFAWPRFTAELPAEIRWALFAMNTFLSLFMLLGGLATLISSSQRDSASVWPIRIMTVYWSFNAAYQIVRPFPTPVVRWVSLAFALMVAALYLFPLLAAPHPSPSRSSS